MSWYYNARPTIKTDEGIKARSKRGAFVKNWWAGRWLEAMEQVMDPGRLQRGRRYARQGQVLELEEGRGQITASVQGSRRTPYRIAIELQPLSDADWARVVAALAERPLFAAQLLAGEMPLEIEEAFTSVHVSLFPGRLELEQDCNCPDWAAVCKHLAAVHYILAERFDTDPFLLFRLRGRNQEEILASLGTGVAPETLPEPEYAPAPPLAESLATFWMSGPELAQFRAHISSPETPYPILDRLGDPDFLPEARRWLAGAYDAVAETAVSIAFDQDRQVENESESA
ncbi:MAG: hypothetical protein JSW55_14660 [Chloroflexota bacterium]|nr:MAG: hypothetical protein JSW55_14660 [Chloroflexota bacterium]